MRAGWTRDRFRTSAALAACIVLMAGAVGCSVKVDKGANGEDKNVQVKTPFGGVNVNTNQTTAEDLGLPAYPGARIVSDKDNDKSADIHMGFGNWQLRVKAVNYATSDSRDKVVAFYKKALGRYGDVIECQNHAAVGKPAVTSEGLTCEERGKHGTHIQVGDSGTGDTDLQLKAGSERHQHIVGFERQEGGQTRFALVLLDLPAGTENGSGKKD